MIRYDSLEDEKENVTFREKEAQPKTGQQRRVFKQVPKIEEKAETMNNSRSILRFQQIHVSIE